MPRVLILCEYPTLLGGERSMLAVLPTVMAAGFDVEIVAPPSGPLADAVGGSGATLVTWQVRDERGVRLPLATLREHVARIIARRRPDLVHANSLSMARVGGPVVAAAGVASVGHLRDIVTLSQQAVADVNCHSRLIAVSEATRVFHAGQGIDTKRTVVVYNGVDLEVFRPRPATGYLHRELNLPTGARLVATIGQLGLRKGTDVAVAAAGKVLAALPDVGWLVLGERTSDKAEAIEFERRLQRAAAELGLAGRMLFLGSRDDVPRILNECELLVHAARQEPLGRVLLEAVASGVAVVATDVGGTREIFPDESAGAVLVPADNPDALASATVELLNNPQRLAILGAAARRRAEVAFDAGIAAGRLIEQYRAVL